MIELRGFQPELERKIYDAWGSGQHNVMAVAPTGGGKTVLFSKIVHDEPGASIAIAHRQELVSQISTALARNKVRHRIVGAKKSSSLIKIISALHIYELGYSYLDPNSKNGVGGVDTIIRMPHDDPYFKQIRKFVIDEAHHVLRVNKWGKACEYFPKALGLFPTATPGRADGRGLGRHADGVIDQMVLGPPMREVINSGFLTDYRIFAPPSDFDRSHIAVSKSTGELNPDQNRKELKRSTVTGDVVGHYLRLAKGKLGVTFCVDVEEATKQAALFRANGVPAEVIHAETPVQLRAEILRRFANREIWQLVNVDLFGEGFDLPAIEVVQFARATESFSVYAQQFGRALRLMLSKEAAAVHAKLDDYGRKCAIAASTKPVALIIDHVGNVVRHGLPDKHREWTLDRMGPKSSGNKNEIPLRVCTECYEPYERIYKKCPNCGHYPEPASRSGPEFVDGDLMELDEATLMELRGEIARINRDPVVPRNLDPIAQAAIRKRHWARQGAQATFRNALSWWAGLQHAQGLDESASMRMFNFKFGVDVGTAQTLGERECLELVDRVNAELSKNGIDGTVNAGVYLENL